MKPAFVVSFVAAACVHALLLFGFRPGTPVRPLPALDTPAVDVSLVEAAPETPSVAPTPADALPPPSTSPSPPVPAPPVEIAPPAPAPVPVATAMPRPAKTRDVPRPAKKIPQGATPQAAPGGAAATGPGATMHARYRSNPKPAYPDEARNLRQEGVVLLGVKVGADGRVVSVSLQRSSGFPLLDQAAISGVKSWTFVPARSAGVAVTSRVDVPIRFSILGR